MGTPERLVAALARRFREAADEERAAGMKAYMRDQFAFLGVPKDTRTELEREAIAEVLGGPRGRLTEAELATTARLLFAKDEREFAYTALTLLRRHVPRVGTPAFLAVLRELVLEKSWWDTVDDLAQNTVGPLVARYPVLTAVMDEWARSDQMWIARTAILHQNKYKQATDAKRLFAYCKARAQEKDFFYRKAIGWALRNYAATAPEAVARFCDANESILSGLSLREARRGVERAQTER